MKNDRKPFLKRRPFSKSKFYTESFEGLNEEKQNQSYLPIKNDVIDSDAVLDGLNDFARAYRHEIKRFVMKTLLFCGNIRTG